MAVGRPPAPRSLKLVRGDRASRINHNEPIPARVGADPPSWLDEYGLECWRYYSEDLEAKSVLTNWDRDSFANLCDALSRRRHAVEHLREEGEVIETAIVDRNGVVQQATRKRRNDWCVVLERADAQIRAYASTFGLTPADRQRLDIKTEQHDTDNPFADGGIS